MNVFKFMEIFTACGVYFTEKAFACKLYYKLVYLILCPNVDSACRLI